MLDKPDSSASPTLRQIAKAFRITGLVSFWTQLVLTVVSSFILLFATAFSRVPAGTTNNTNTGIGIVLTVLGILGLGFNMYWALFRYVPISKRLADDPRIRPKKSETIQVLRIGLLASLIGTLIALLGAEAIVGLLAAKAFSQGAGGFVNVDPTKFIQPLDVLVVQASINVILAQFVAISAALWLLNKMSRQ
jgi:hypothetical protein